MRIGGTYLKAQIARHGGFEGFAHHFGLREHPTTVWRWVEGGAAPQTIKQLIDVAARMGTDPVNLFELSQASLLETISAFGAGRPRRGLLALLARMFAPSAVGGWSEWPPYTVVSTASAWPWHKQIVEHDPRTRRDYYARLLLSGTSLSGQEPIVAHIAYRDVRPARSAWHPFGLVRAFDGEVTAFHFAGMVVPDRWSGGPFVVETWFGRGAAEFQIASIHPLGVELVAESDRPTVRFGFPGEPPPIRR